MKRVEPRAKFRHPDQLCGYQMVDLSSLSLDRGYGALLPAFNDCSLGSGLSLLRPFQSLLITVDLGPTPLRPSTWRAQHWPMAQLQPFCFLGHDYEGSSIRNDFPVRYLNFLLHKSVVLIGLFQSGSDEIPLTRHTPRYG
jgi:hypothetical protein